MVIDEGDSMYATYTLLGNPTTHACMLPYRCTAHIVRSISTRSGMGIKPSRPVERLEGSTTESQNKITEEGMTSRTEQRGSKK